MAAALVVVLGGALPLQAAPSNYEALRLLTEALHEISQKFVTPKKEGEMLDGALRGMVNSLDPDSSFLTPEEYADYQKGAKGYAAEAGLELVFKDHVLTAVSVLDEGPAARAGMKAGDHILKIDGQLIRNLTTQEGMRRFQGPAGKNLKLQVLRNGLVKPLDLTLVLEPLGPPRLSFLVLKDGYAYIRIPYFSDEVPGELAKVLNQVKHQTPPVKGLILDLRNNARGTLEQSVKTASLFIGGKEVVTTKGRLSGTDEKFTGSPQNLALKPGTPLVILVDQGTARAAEILTAALRHYGLGVTLGAKTFGLCGVTRAMPLQDGSALLMTVAYCYTPGGKKISGQGLEPDVEGVKPGEGAAQHTGPAPPPDKDPWVLQALELLKSGKAAQLAKSAPAY
uniref:S41 family peptidase n=1 Tax=Desulfobacca acetoxidans TaxID=60893 RepID=A0A7V4G8L9_9BACT